MAITSSIPITLNPAFPVAGLGFVACFLLHTWQQTRVTAFRKMSGVHYPVLYASDSEAKADVKKMKYNCMQRAHANTLENMPFILAEHMFLSVSQPILSTALVGFYVFGRIFYTIGYSTGDPKARNPPLALVSYIGNFGLLLSSIVVAGKAAYQYLA